MTVQFVSRLFLSAAVMTAVTIPAATAHAAASAGDKCAAGVALAMAKCVKKAVGTHAKCFKGTGEACAPADEKLAGAYSTAATLVRAKCPDNAAVADAGYGPVTPVQLGAHFGDLCAVQARVVSERTFGADGSNYSSADAIDKKCLEAAAKEAGKFLAATLTIHGKCVGKDCVPAETTTAIEEKAAAAVAKIDGKCAGLSDLTDLTTTAFVDAAEGQVPSAVASPCDPMNTSRCAYPFPNDYYTVPGADTPSGRRLAIGRHTLPANRVNKPVIATQWNNADGFSIGPMLLINDVNVDLSQTDAAPITDIAKSLDSDTAVSIVDAETGEKQLLFIERDVHGDTTADQPLIIRVMKNLKNSHRYIVAMRNMKDSSGATLPASAGFAIYRDNTPTDLLPVELRRPHMEEVLTKLVSFGYDRSSLYLAWDFTTQSEESTAGRLLAMRDDATELLGVNAPAFTVGTVADNPDAGIFRRIDGTFQVPLYMNGDGVPGQTMRVDNYGTPVNDGDYYTAGYRCIIPTSATTGGAAPAVPARLSLYGHGLLGSRNEVNAGNVRAMANEHNFIFCATDWSGFAGEDALFVIDVLKDFTNFPTFIDRQHQGMLNMQFLGKLMLHADGFASHAAFQVGGQSMLDRSDLFYDGNSQGGILGGVLAAVAQDVTRFSLGVPGINYSFLLNRSVDFEEYDEGYLTPNYQSASDRNILLSAAQVLWDRTDPNGHVTHVTSDTYADTPAKKILYQVAFGDHQVAPVTAEIAARSNGARIHTPVLDEDKVVPEVTPYYGITPIDSYPYDGSALVIWDSGNPAPPTSNIPPAEITNMDPEWADLEACVSSSGDPHGCPRSDPDARIQKSEFLKTNGAVVDACAGDACIAQ